MKKLLSLFLSIQLFFMMSVPAFAVPTKIKITKQNNKYGVISKETKKLLIPYEYDEIKKLSDEAVKVRKGNLVGILYNDNTVMIPVKYTAIVSKTVKTDEKKYTNYYAVDAKNNLLFSKLTTNYNKKSANKNSFIKEAMNYNRITGYPEKNVLIAVPDETNKDNVKVGFVRELGDNSYSTIPAFYEDYYFPDEKSVISQTAHISYFDDFIITKKSGKWGVIDKNGKTIINFSYDKIITFDPVIDEPFTYNKSNYGISYSKIAFPVKNRFIAFKNNNFYILNNKGRILFSGRKPNIVYNDNSPDLIKTIYEQNNRKSNIKFVDFPLTGVVKYKQGDKYGVIIVSENGVEKIPAEYRNIYFPDDNSLVFNMLGISYAPPEQIWGMKYAKAPNNSKSLNYRTIKGNSGSIGHSYKLDVSDLKMENDTNKTFKEYIKPAVTFENEVILLNGYAKIVSKKVQPSNVNFSKYRKSSSAKSHYKTVLGDVAINVTDASSDKPKITTISHGYISTKAKERRSVFVTILLAPFYVIAFPFIVLFFAFFAHR